MTNCHIITLPKGRNRVVKMPYYNNLKIKLFKAIILIIIAVGAVLMVTGFIIESVALIIIGCAVIVLSLVYLAYLFSDAKEEKELENILKDNTLSNCEKNEKIMALANKGNLCAVRYIEEKVSEIEKSTD